MVITRNTKHDYVYIAHEVEHRIIMEQHLSRKLDYNEVVHHINGNKHDNRLENLQVMTRKDHAKLHGKTCVMVKVACTWCGEVFEIRPCEYRARLKNNKCGVCCTQVCAGKLKRYNQLLRQ